MTITILALLGSQPSLADSPDFPSQEIKDGRNDWNTTLISSNTYITPERQKLCEKANTSLESPNIDSVKYSSDGKFLKSNVYLTDKFNKFPLTIVGTVNVEINKNDTEKYSVSYDYKRYSMILDIKSAFDIGPDYGVEYAWLQNYDRSNWYESSFELSSNGNFTPISSVKNNNFIKNNLSIPFDFDLAISNFPKQYNVNILFEEGYILKGNGTTIYCTRADISQSMPIPPPDLSIRTSSNSIDLRPGETGNLLLKVNNKSGLNAKISLVSLSGKLPISFSPNPILVSFLMPLQ